MQNNCTKAQEFINLLFSLLKRSSLSRASQNWLIFLQRFVVHFFDLVNFFFNPWKFVFDPSQELVANLNSKNKFIKIDSYLRGFVFKNGVQYSQLKIQYRKQAIYLQLF